MLVRSYSGKGIGVDIAQTGHVDVVIEDAANLEFNDESFDTVSIIAALNHIPNRKDVLKEAHRVLREDGKLIITMIPPKFSRIWHLLRRPWADEIERDFTKGQVYGLSKNEITALLSEIGFKIILHNKFMLGINNLIIAKKQKKH